MSPAPPSSLALLDRRLATLMAGIAARWGVYVCFLDNGDEITVNADVKMDTMSLIKVPILVTLMRRADRGEVDLDQVVTLRDDDKRLGTGILRLFKAGATFCLRDAAWMMIAVSDNTATDICLAVAGGVDAVNRCMAGLGIDGIEMTGTALEWFRALGGSMDPELARIPPGEFAARGYPALGAAGLSDARARYHFETGQAFSLATPRALGELLSRINAGTCASPAASGEMMAMLKGQQLRNFLPRFVWGADFAHKTGNFSPFIASDIGIVTPIRGTPVIICLLTAGFNGTTTVLEDCIGRMAELIVLEAEHR